MNRNLEETLQIYKRELTKQRLLLGLAGLVIAVVTLVVAVNWPKTYTASATIYADNSNILRPLMDGNAVARFDGENQARMAQDILFSRNYNAAILEAAGYNPATLTPVEIDQLVAGIQSRTTINNVGRGAARLVMISHSDADPIKAFRVVQKYTSIFIEQASISEQEESRSAFQFIERQVAQYQQKLQESEARLSAFKSANNFGTLTSANNRIASYEAEIERIDLDLVQIDSQVEIVEAQLAGELTVSRDLSEVNSIRSRINSLQLTLDNLRSRFHDTYPDVVQVKNQIDDLRRMLEEGGRGDAMPVYEGLGEEGVTPLHQELRSRLASLQSTRESRISERQGLIALLAAERERATRINETEAELAELTRDYNVTQNFYNTLLGRLENARLTVNLNQEEQGINFKVQESAVIPTRPDGFSFSQLMMASLMLAVGVPLGTLALWLEIDPRIRSESSWSKDWPPLLGTVPPMKASLSLWRSNYIYLMLLLAIAASVYGFVAYAHIVGLID